MESFKDIKERLLSTIQNRPMVLSTSRDGHVSSRMMSIIIIDGEFYFQTDVTMRKCKDMESNKNVALCFDNTQIEGTVEKTASLMILLNS